MTDHTNPKGVFEPDGWDARFRVGLLVPEGDVGPESEWSAIVPTGISINASRFQFPVASAERAVNMIATAPVEFVAASGPLDAAVAGLSASVIDIFSLAFTSTSYVADDAELVERLSAAANGRPVVTTGQALLAAVAHLGARRVMLVDPPWFPTDLTQLGEDWLKRNGVEVSATEAAGIPSGQGNVHPGALYRWLRTSIAPGTDAVLIGGNGFRAVGVVRAIEADTGIPVITANTALLWQTLRTLGLSTDTVTRYGQLFSASAG